MNKKIRFRILVSTGLLFCAITSRAQDSTRQLTLQQAIDLSIANSKNLKISRARIDEATAQVQEATDARLPDIKRRSTTE